MKLKFFRGCLSGEAASGQESVLGAVDFQHHTHRRVSAPNRRWQNIYKSVRTLYFAWCTVNDTLRAVQMQHEQSQIRL